jgi:hypothetical protein
MSKLYLFGIGGTGARVIKSLTMLFAAGCELKNYSKVIPIIIDPDSGNGDLNRTKEILSLYQKIRNQISEPDDFFKQDITTINNLTTGNPKYNDSDFCFELENVDSEKFKEYIHYSSLPDEDKAIVDLLYSKENLEADLNIGFKGHPNMGSIVLNQFTQSEAFKSFGNSFSQGDSIFIINSIFGGTGAAGYPLLLKHLRSGADITHGKAIKECAIGAITYLPYFKLKEGEIKSGTFIGKSKAALDYYNRTIIDKEIDCQYFLGDIHNNSTYDNHVGQKDQMNDGHFLELAGALSIFDFDQNTPPNRLRKTIVKEFGVEDFDSMLDFDHLHDTDRSIANLPIRKYSLFATYLKEGLSKALGVSRWTVKKTELNKTYFNSPEYQNEIAKFNKRYLEWITEISRNKPEFLPKLLRQLTDKSLFKKLDILNCKEIDNVEATKDIHTQLVKLFATTTANQLGKQL